MKGAEFVLPNRDRGDEGNRGENLSEEMENIAQKTCL